MLDQHFISYSSVDGAGLAQEVSEALRGGSPSIPTWLDKNEMKPGQDWDDQLLEAIRRCRSLLFVMTPDSVTSRSVCKKEWSRALSYKKPIFPLLCHPEAEPPFRLQDRQHLDFTGNFPEAVEKLRCHLLWLESPAGVCHGLQERLRDAQHDLFRCGDPRQRARIQEEIALLEKQVADQQRLIFDPRRVAEQADRNISQGLERDRLSAPPAPAPTRVKRVNVVPAVAPAHFQDREGELRRLTDFFRDDSLRCLSIVGRGGTGKTVLVCQWLQALDAGRLPGASGPPLLEGVVSLGPGSSRDLTAQHLCADLARLFESGPAGQGAAPDNGTERLRSLLAGHPDRRGLLLLDNFEDQVDPQTLHLRDPELLAALRTLLDAPGHGVKVVVTTRVAPRDLALVQPARQARLDLDEGLPSPFAQNLLRAMDVDGKVGLKTAADELLDEAHRRTRGYPRALEALFAILSADRSTSLREVFDDNEHILPENVVEALVGEAFNRLEVSAQRVMQALAIYGRPVTPVAVDYLLQPHLPSTVSKPTLNRLVNMQFARKEAGRYSLHPIDRAFALESIPRGEKADRCLRDQSLFTRFALLNRGADYFREVRRPRESWRTIEDIAPLLSEFDLRLAGQDYDAAARVLAEMNLPSGDNTARLLADQEARNVPEPARDAEGQESIPRKFQALVVDDSPMDRHLVQAQVAHDFGAQAVSAGGGLEALTIMAEQQLDVVIADVLMPEMDGLQLVEAIRSRYPLVPVILMTAHGSEDLAIQALQKGAASYVPKKSLARDLASTLEQVLAASRTGQYQRTPQAECRFILENEPALIPSLLGTLSRVFSGMEHIEASNQKFIRIALQEALLNAILHGNLELSSSLRETDEAEYQRLLVERRRQAPYSDRRVYFTALATEYEVRFVIRDEGPGFDTSSLPDPTDPGNLNRIAGRGFMLIQLFMDRVDHNAEGNEITLTKRCDR